jgi:hypothetical protein
MTAFEDQRSVWTETDDPEWLAKYENRAMVIAGNLSEDGARFMCQRLLLLRPDLKFWIEDNHNSVVSTFELREAVTTPPQPARAGRRALGIRGQA